MTVAPGATCPSCHAPVAAGSAFCTRCGAPVGVREIVAQVGSEQQWGGQTRRDRRTRAGAAQAGPHAGAAPGVPTAPAAGQVGVLTAPGAPAAARVPSSSAQAGAAALGPAFDGVVPARVGRRLLAYTVDLLAVCLVGGLVWWFTGQQVVYAALAAGELAVGLVLWEARGGLTFGNGLLGLRTAAVERPYAPGLGRALGRGLILGASNVLAGVGPWILIAGAGADRSGRGQALHDRAARTVVVDVRAMRVDPVEPAEIVGPVVRAGAGQAPVLAPVPPPPAAIVQAPVTPVPAPPKPTRGPAVPVPTPPTAAASTHAQRRPVPAPPTSAAPPAVPSAPAPSVPGGRHASTPPVPAPPARPAASAAAGSPSTAGAPGGQRPVPAPPTAPASTGAGTAGAAGAGARDGAAAPAGTGTAASPAGPPAAAAGLGRPNLGAAVPPVPAPPKAAGASSSAEVPAVPAAAPGGRGYVLTLDTGQVVEVTGAGVIGRRPRPVEGEDLEHLVEVDDPSRSMSRTHAMFGVADGVFWVADRGSANGTFLRDASGAWHRLETGTRYPVAPGGVVRLGERSFTVTSG